MTSPAHPAAGKAPWGALGPEIPDDLAGTRVLAVQVGDGDAPEALRDRGAEQVVQWRFPEPLEDPGEPFDLVFCAGALQGDPHPMNLLTRIWHLTRTGGTLLLESQVLTAAEVSRYGLFVNEGATASHWVPGRLALRWMIESSGFDVDRWVEEGARGTEAPERDSACLRATRTDRPPALDLANPHSQAGA